MLALPLSLSPNPHFLLLSKHLLIARLLTYSEACSHIHYRKDIFNNIEVENNDESSERYPRGLK